MKPSRIKYNPYLSVEEIAQNSGVTVEAVKQYIKTRRIDRKYDEQLIKYRKVQEYVRKGEYTVPQIANILGFSPTTVRRYSDKRHIPKPNRDKVSALNQIQNTLFVSVSEFQGEILRSILAFHLNNDVTFDCDLTTAKGDFYKTCVPLPRFLYDINPQIDSVKTLEEAINLPDDIFNSIVIDLPYLVIRPTSRRKKTSFASFDSIEQMHQTYTSMIQLAWRLLKENGVLVFKAVDYKIAKEPIWTSDWSISTAVSIGFTLIDKYIYIDRKAMNAISSSQRRSYNPAHAFFLVFRKSGKTEK